MERGETHTHRASLRVEPASLTAPTINGRRLTVDAAQSSTGPASDTTAIPRALADPLSL